MSRWPSTVWLPIILTSRVAFRALSSTSTTNLGKTWKKSWHSTSQKHLQKKLDCRRICFAIYRDKINKKKWTCLYVKLLWRNNCEKQHNFGVQQPIVLSLNSVSSLCLHWVKICRIGCQTIIAIDPDRIGPYLENDERFQTTTTNACMSTFLGSAMAETHQVSALKSCISHSFMYG